MIQTGKQQELRRQCAGAEVFPTEVLNWIQEENLWNLWVPETYGGLGLPLTGGLAKLKELARIDGSLGWTVTLCSGANYFIGNLQQDKAQEIFIDSGETVCFGGSGGVLGTAELVDDHYKISGKWRYATGAPYLTHFTLNAELRENGNVVRNGDGSPKVLSFVISKEKVRIIEDWNTMGLKATATFSFEVNDVLVHKSNGFLYNDHHLPDPIFKIPFSVFADLTLWINYIGMAQHLYEEAFRSIDKGLLDDLEHTIKDGDLKIFRYAEQVENGILTHKSLDDRIIQEVHHVASESIKTLSRHIIGIFPFLGVNASRDNHPLNQIFRDYFTATQHHNFTK